MTNDKWIGFMEGDDRRTSVIEAAGKTYNFYHQQNQWDNNTSTKKQKVSIVQASCTL